MKRRLLMVLVALSFLASVYVSAVRPLLLSIIPLPSIPGGIVGQTLPAVLFAFTHAVYALGWRHALAFFGIGTVVSWTLEHVGVACGCVYGGYYYTGLLGTKLGYVPALIPLSWFMMLYSSYVVVNCMIGDPPVGSRGSLARIVWVSFVSGVVMTAQDLILDPIMAGPVIQAWVWEQGGGYFGVPALNYLGWIVTSFIVYVSYRLLEWRLSPRPLGPMTRTITTMPLVIYGLLIVTGTLSIAPSALTVVGPFVLGLPLLVAITRVWFPVAEQPLSSP